MLLELTKDLLNYSWNLIPERFRDYLIDKSSRLGLFIWKNLPANIIHYLTSYFEQIATQSMSDEEKRKLSQLSQVEQEDLTALLDKLLAQDNASPGRFFDNHAANNEPIAIQQNTQNGRLPGSSM